MYSIVKCADIVCANGGTHSAIVKANEQYADAQEIGLISPASMEAGIIQVSIDGENFFNYQGDGTSDVPYPTASDANWLNIPFPFFRLAIGADTFAEERTVQMCKRIITT
jgi:hypothetical protein